MRIDKIAGLTPIFHEAIRTAAILALLVLLGCGRSTSAGHSLDSGVVDTQLITASPTAATVNMSKSRDVEKDYVTLETSPDSPVQILDVFDALNNDKLKPVRLLVRNNSSKPVNDVQIGLSYPRLCLKFYGF